MIIGTSTVLVIDDQPGIRRLLEEVLAEEGYDVVAVANGYDGVQKARESEPDVILMDMKMPGMDGIETLRELKRYGYNTRAIMMTAYGELDLINEAKDLGIFTYITKPFDINVLCDIIKDSIKNNAVNKSHSIINEITA